MTLTIKAWAIITFFETIRLSQLISERSNKPQRIEELHKSCIKCIKLILQRLRESDFSITHFVVYNFFCRFLFAVGGSEVESVFVTLEWRGFIYEITNKQFRSGQVRSELATKTRMTSQLRQLLKEKIPIDFLPSSGATAPHLIFIWSSCLGPEPPRNQKNSNASAFPF